MKDHAPPISGCRYSLRIAVAGFSCFALMTLAACSGSDGSDGKDGKDFTEGPGRGDSLPGVVVTITGLEGNSPFQPGNTITVNFTVENDAGDDFELAEMTRGAIMVSGPTFNYQRVIESQSDLLTRSTKKGDGSYSYRFAMPIPATYLAPLNDTTTLTEGELTGQPLLAGTYTVGIELRQDYEIDGATVRDPGNATFDFLLGSATTLEPRDVVTQANCTSCHGEVRAHGGNRTDVKNCLLCHTTGAEDGNVATVEGGTPGATIDFRVMIHKIHSGKHLPSVLGVTTNPDGTRKYDEPKQPYKLVGFNDSVVDYSEIALPLWPSLASPMPADLGYNGLSSVEQGLENSMRSGPVACDACHGDPDGAGPLPAPAQGDLIYAQPTRLACASCHDDWIPARVYRANTGGGMPVQNSDATCNQCHNAPGTALDTRDAHVHPLLNITRAPGINVNVTAVAEAGTNNADGTIDPGEKVAVTFTVKNTAGTDIPLTDLSRFEFALSGPTTNPNLVHLISPPTVGYGAGPTYTMLVPQRVYLELIGVSTSGTTGESWGTARFPVWNVTGATPNVFIGTASGSVGQVAAAAAPPQNYLDLMPGQGTGFARNNYIVVDPGNSQQEYLQVQWVDGDRLWFSSQSTPAYPTGPRQTHTVGANVAVVTLTERAAADYTVNSTNGTITEVNEFGNGIVVASYTTDFVLPATYPAPPNDTPDLGQSWGEWPACRLVDGTYTVGLWGSRAFDVDNAGQLTSYREASKPSNVNVLVGAATVAVPSERLASVDACYACHQDIQFHGGGRRGVETCLHCHGVAGAEDRATYVAPGDTMNPAPRTTGVTIDFRTMLHKIHHGKELAKGAEYTVLGFGNPYPNNYTAFTYDHIGYPAMPGGTMDCASCHGADNEAWKAPATRLHPSQTVPTRAWRAACGSCHDSDAATAHIDVMTSPAGAESCAVCHGAGKGDPVEVVHKVQ